MSKIQAIRGMNDILPGQSEIWLYVEDTIKQVLKNFGYQHVRMPIVEKTGLFTRGIGEVTDIVEKEMYTFLDRNDESLALRPEGTAGCVRAGIEHGLFHNQIQRLWYTGPMFRYEKPQKGRYRQFHQIGVETFGMATAQIDAELIILTSNIWKAFGITDSLELQLNTLGSNEARANYKVALVDFLNGIKADLDEDSQNRIDTNPLRVLDSKEATTQTLLDGAPDFNDYIDDESKAHFEELKALLDASGVVYTLNPRLVRGLDYYNKTVFEWVTKELGSQGTVCGGGRYDSLVEQLGGKSVPASGFGMGVERFILLLEAMDALPEAIKATPDVYFVAAGDGCSVAQFKLTQQLREHLPNIHIITDCTGSKFKAQMKKADASGAKVCLILGENELSEQTIAVKDLRNGEQNVIQWDKLNNELLIILEK
ncbi:histidyl-tRNA synthetase [Marinicellulosiphila megalodicopiae]